MIIYEDSSAIVKYDSSVPCIVWTPLKFMKDENWRNPFNKGFEFLEEQIKTTPELTWLNDSRKLISVPLDDLRWLNRNVNDRGFKFGVRKIAFVLPENIFGKMAVKFYVEYTNARMDNKFQIKAFKTYDDAVKWLKAKVQIAVEEVQL